VWLAEDVRWWETRVVTRRPGSGQTLRVGRGGICVSVASIRRGDMVSPMLLSGGSRRAEMKEA
jgi:hypothetical protein